MSTDYYQHETGVHRASLKHKVYTNVEDTVWNGIPMEKITKEILVDRIGESVAVAANQGTIRLVENFLRTNDSVFPNNFNRVYQG